MTAVDIFKQSLTFYGRLFNKIFWLSVASSLVPLLIFGGTATQGQMNPMAMLVGGLMSMFFSVYVMCLIHQYSTEQDDSLGSAFSLTAKKFLPITITSFVFGIGAIVVGLPAALVATILGAGIADKGLQAGFITLIVIIPLGWYMYRCFFAPYQTLAFSKNPIDALKASNQQIKGNKLVFRGFTLLSFVMLAYLIVVLLLNHMLAVSPAARTFAEFTIGVFVMPFFSIFIYRLFFVSLPPSDSKEEQDDSNEPPSIDEEV